MKLLISNLLIKTNRREMSKNHKEAVEITKFKLKGYTCQEFIKANKDADAFLKRQSRRTFEQRSTIVDMLIWNSVDGSHEHVNERIKRFQSP
jgi:hypothetical protein